jgi:hypothetical protein
MWRWALRSWRCSAVTPPSCGGCRPMIEMLIWGAGAVVIAGYMIAALVKPEKF